MSALLGNPMVTTAALPLAARHGAWRCWRGSPCRRPRPCSRWCAAALLLFFYWDTLGPPVVPPVAASQKLIYLAFAGIIVGLLPERPARRGRAASMLVAAALWPRRCCGSAGGVSPAAHSTCR